jgi:hypothetical protein
MGIIREQGVPAKTGRTLRTALGQMYQAALTETRGSHNEAEVKLAQSIDNDRRFDVYPTNRLVSRFRDCYQTGGFLDLDDDPYLKGGAPRPGGLVGRSAKVS